jgi:hypothetical protein
LDERPPLLGGLHRHVLEDGERVLATDRDVEEMRAMHVIRIPIDTMTAGGR